MLGHMDFQSDWFAAGPGGEPGRRGRGHGRPGKRGRGQHFGPPGMEPRQRMSRGDIKYILLSLLAEESQHGYQLMKNIESRWGGFYRLSPGSVYPTLQLLEEGGYLTSNLMEGKKVYTITDSGRDLLDQQGGSYEAVTTLEVQPQLIELHNNVRDVQEAIAQVARSGKVEKIGTVINSLKQLKREIYLLLAED